MVCRAHKEVLFFASPFFEAALSGSWAETGRRHSMSSVITISQPPSIPGDRSISEVPTEMVFAPIDPEPDSEDIDDASYTTIAKTEGDAATTSDSENEAEHEGIDAEDLKAKARKNSLEKLESGNGKRSSFGNAIDNGKQKGSANDTKLPYRKLSQAQATVKRPAKACGSDAVIVLKEERVCEFIDFQSFVLHNVAG
jgi:hypothetical protein